MHEVREQALTFACAGETLVGVLALPEAPPRGAVLIVVGGPQYRAGSHRQFVSLARALAQAGFANLRFDYRGMGDSDGAARDFLQIEDDIHAAIDAFLAQVPGPVDVTLWGLCDAATAALLYAPRDPRVARLILANPWMRGAETLARTQLRHYYLRRVIQAGFWRKLLAGRLKPATVVGDLGRSVSSALGGSAADNAAAGDYRQRAVQGWWEFKGDSLVLISTADLTAQEFLGFMAADPLRRRVFARSSVERHDIADADHTFSRPDWQAAAEQASIDWLLRRHAVGRSSAANTPPR